MVGDLQRRHLRPGISREEVVRLLGKPDRTDTQIAHRNNSGPKRRREKYIYELGACNDIDGWLLVIRLDQSGRLIDSELEQT